MLDVLRLPPLRPYQVPVLLSEVRDDFTLSAPQLGKTITGAAWLLSAAWYGGESPSAWIWYAPTYLQASDGFRKLTAMARSAGVLAETTISPPLVAKLINGARLEARSWERPENLYGTTIRGGVVDEFGALTREAYSAISSRRAETIGRGEGLLRYLGNTGEVGGEAERLWRLAESDAPGFASRRWTWRDRALAYECACGEEPGGIYPELSSVGLHFPACLRGVYIDFIASEAGRMSGPQFRALYEAEWTDANALPVYTFDRAVHVRSDLRLDASLPLIVACDFNVDPMVWIVGQSHQGEAWALDEIVIEGGATTIAAARELTRRYPGRDREVIVYGDASGNSRKTSATRTDYQIIRDVLGAHYSSLSVRSGGTNPAVLDRVHAVNALLRSADGRIRFSLHSRCRVLADDLARVSWKPGTRDIDKNSNRSLTHASDALGYWLFRVGRGGGRIAFGLVPLRAGSPVLGRW